MEGQPDSSDIVATHITISTETNSDVPEDSTQNIQTIEVESEIVEDGFVKSTTSCNDNDSLKRHISETDFSPTNVFNKKIKTEHDYGVTSNGLPKEDYSKALFTCDQTLHSENSLFTKEYAEECIEEDVKKLGESILEDIMEYFFLENNGKAFDFYCCKKRPPLQFIPNSLSQWFQQISDESCVEYIKKLLDFNVASGRISDHSSSVHTSLASLPSSISSNTNYPQLNFATNHRHEHSSSNEPSLNSTSSVPRVNSSSVSSVLNSTSNVSTTIQPEKLPLRKSSISASLEESSIGTREQIVEQAKQEAYVMQRIAELRKNGIWSTRRLPKVQEPPRTKVHWDFLLEEMQWLAADFLQERKWKRNSAKKCSKMITKYYQYKECQAEKNEREEQNKLKRIASNIAKLVKQFWSQIEKVVETKQEAQLTHKRKKIHDMQLRFIVDKADHFTEKLAQEFVTPSLKNSRAPSVDSELLTENSNELRENNTKAITRDYNEIELLKKESEMPIEELADSLPKEFVETLTSKVVLSDEPEDDDIEFEKGNSCSDDDEETIAKEEDQEANESVDQTNELNDLQSDANLPIDELLSRYGYGDETPESDDKTEYTTADDETENNESENEDSDETDEDIDNSVEIGIKYLVNETNSAVNEIEDTENKTKKEITDLAAEAAESIQPKGNTLSSVEVITKVPFLLKYQLREYQHIGLDWLVAMYEKNLNGILADEMGLGKTIQTISLIGHLACEKGIWGPHLIVVPTSVMLNWEMEFKKWCPALKILTYYGNPKERRLKRKGWTKPNTFHVCITSYKLVVQDHQSFRRKKWIYFILDEAQHIKNFKSQRWQMLLNFNSSRRLLLTGTPLQNNLMELWSLMHFLMPNVFQSHREFKDWFVNPVTGMVEGNNEKNDELIRRLHKVLRPFLLRRLKCDVEKQLPKKFEHLVTCSLSKRQRLLYDEFMSLGKTKETLATGNFLSVINILMQLRKVCNHPNLFDPRPTVTPFIDSSIEYCIPSLITSILDYQPLFQIDLRTLNLVFSHLSLTLANWDWKTIHAFQYDQPKMNEICNNEISQIYVRLTNSNGFHRYLANINTNLNGDISAIHNGGSNVKPRSDKVLSSTNNSQLELKTKPKQLKIANQSAIPEDKPQIENEKIENNENSKEGTLGFGKFAKNETKIKIEEIKKDKLRKVIFVNRRRCDVEPQYYRNLISYTNFSTVNNVCAYKQASGGYVPSIYSQGNGFSHCLLTKSNLASDNPPNVLSGVLFTPETLEASLKETLTRYLCMVPSVISSPVNITVTHPPSYKKIDQLNYVASLDRKLPSTFFDVVQIPRIQLRFQLPEIRLIQYDCGKLQVLDKLLWRLRSEKHRVLIFTQMSRMLDIFEQFLNYHGHTYLRLDGSTKIEQRQALMERFNSDQRIFCFILSTRSGGVGVNLTGADTVIFYDSDWNPTMDAQAQDRCHRIGQTRDVHIYRLISERTVEENILKKAQQKKLLGDLAIEDGNFTTAFFKQGAIKELFEIDINDSSAVNTETNKELTHEANVDATSNNLEKAFEQALCTAEEDTDVAAAKVVRAEVAAEFDEFDENIPISEDKSPEEEEIDQLISQLSSVEKYALKFAESLQDFQELKQVEEEIEETKKRMQNDILKWDKDNEENRQKMVNDLHDSIMTCSREDASVEKVFMSTNGLEPMPVWAPPTPPQDDDNIELYIDYSIGFMYEKTIMPESQLPPIYVPKEHKRQRLDIPLPQGRKHLQPNHHMTNSHVHAPAHVGPATTKSQTRRNDDLYTIPKSPFDRSTSSICRLRRELLLTKIKLWPGSANLISSIQRTISQMGPSSIPPSNITSSQALAKNLSFNSAIFPRWLIHEEFAIIMVLLYLQDLPFNLSTICPGHIPNWDFVAEQVNTFNSSIRCSKFCKFHFEFVIAAKDDQRFLSTEGDMKTPVQNHMLKQSKSSKKNKNNQSVLPHHQSNIYMSQSTSQGLALNPSLPVNGPSGLPGKSSSANAIPPSTQPLVRISNILQNTVSDNNLEFTNEMNRRFDAIKQIVIQKTQTSKSRFKKPQPKSFDHISLLLNDYDIKYDKPLSVEEIAANRAERISKDKQAAREQQAREQQQQREISQIKAQLLNSQPNTSSGHFANISSISGVSVSSNSGHIQQQPPQVLINQVSTATNQTVGHIQSQPQQSSHVLINQVSPLPNSTAFITSPQLQHVLTSKKLQSLNAVSDSSKVLADHSSSMGTTSNSNLNHKLLNSQVVSMQSSSPNVQHVTISQALLGQNSTPMPGMQQSSELASLPSTLQQHLQSQQQAQTQQSGQFIQSNHLAQQIPVSVLSTNNSSQIQQKLIAIASNANINPNVTQTNTNVNQSNYAQLISSGRFAQMNQFRLSMQMKKNQQLQQQHQLQQQTSTGVQMQPQPRQIQMQSIRAQGGSAPTIQRFQITSLGGQSSNLALNQSLISSAGIKQVVTSISTSPSVANSQSHASIIGSSQRIFTSSAPPGHVIATTVSGSIIATNKMPSNNSPIIARTIRTDGNLNLPSQLHGSVTVVPSSLASSNSITAVPIARNIQLLQKRQPSIQVSSTAASQQVLMHKAIVQQSGTGHSIVVSSDGSQQSHSGASSSANIITPLLQSSNSAIMNKPPNTFQIMPGSIVQQQSGGPITVTTKLTGTPSVTMQQMQQALKQGQIIMQQPNQVGGQVTQPANHLATSSAANSTTTNFILAQQQSPQIKTSSGQHFIAVTSTDSQSPISVNATTIKLLPTSVAALAIQQGQASTSSSGTLPQSISTPKGHIIISGHAASLVGQPAGMVTTTAASQITPSALLQQVVSNHSSSNSGQTLTFAIRTSHGQQLPPQPQPGTVHLGALTLKTSTSSGVSMQHASPMTTTNVTQQPSALVAALTQPSPSLSESYQNVTSATANSTLLRTLASSNVSTKAIPIVLMQSSQNANLITPNTPSSVSLLSFTNSASSSSTSRPIHTSANKITTSTQTSGATIGSILSAAAKVGSNSESHFPSLTGTMSSKPVEVQSPLIEALMSPIGKPPPRITQLHTKPDQNQSEGDK